MKNLRAFLILFLLSAVSGLAAVQEAVQWNASEYSDQFKYFREQQSPDRESWDTLTPEQQNQELESVKAKSDSRREQMGKYYAGAMGKWDIGQLRDRLDAVTDQDIEAVHLWLGREQGSALERKISTLRDLTLKAERQGLDDKDLAALEPYLKPDALAGLKASWLAADSVRKPGKAGKNKTGPELSRSGKELGKFSGSDPSGLSAGKFSEFYDGNAARKKSEEPSPGVNISSKKNGAKAAPVETQARKSLKTAGVPVLTDPTLPMVSYGTFNDLTSDAYGTTINVAGKTAPLTFRDGQKTQDAIRRLPDGSVTKIIFYGHGSPGAQSVGDKFSLDADSSAKLLKGKMSPGGVVWFSGCNTADVGGSSLNPAVGLSILARRFVYVDVATAMDTLTVRRLLSAAVLPYVILPYTDAAADIKAEQLIRQKYENLANANLARDTSVRLPEAVVCGYRTFALVPGRLPIITTLMGNQEAVTPGYVAGKKACYRGGQEVPAQ